MQPNPRLNHAWWTLRAGLGLCAIFAGLDKFFDLLTNWEMYLNPLIPGLLQITAPTFMHIAGVVEMAVGVLIFTRFTRYAAYIIMAWLLAISASLVTQGQFLDIAVRDIELSLGAFVLAKLTEVRQESAVREASSNTESAPAAKRAFERLA
jgi:uncharacterized membrane protein YphA (DoxX/SURF4 family)